LFSLAIYSVFLSFLNTTAFRDQLPSFSYLLSHPLSGVRQFSSVYKLHVAHESEKVAELRRRKLEDVKKREEFLRAHGVEPGFLTGSWVDKFGTVEGDRAREKQKAEREGRVGEKVEGTVGVDREIESPIAMAAAVQGLNVGSGATLGNNAGDEETVAATPPREKRKPKIFGIW